MRVSRPLALFHPPPPHCSEAQSVTNAKLGPWVGTPLEAMCMAWSVPRDGLGRLDYLSQPSSPPPLLEGRLSQRPVSATPLEACCPAPMWEVGAQPGGTPFPGQLYTHTLSLRQLRRTQYCTSGRAVSSHNAPHTQPPPPHPKIGTSPLLP